MRRWHAGNTLIVAAVVAALGLAPPAHAAPGSLDPSFGTGGKVVTPFGNDVSVGNAITLQADGRIIVGGRAGGSLTGAFALARYQPNGALDATFGSGGRVVTDFSGAADLVRAVAIQQPGDKIIAAGLAGSEPFGDFALARYLPNGTLDSTFGTGGRVTTDLSNGLGDGIRGMVVQADGKIVAAGAASADSALVRYLPNGSLDPTFGQGGVAKLNLGEGDHVFALAQLADGKYVVAGVAASDFLVARLTPEGRLDPSFGTGGKTTTDFGRLQDLAFAVAVRPDGRIVLAGETGAVDILGITSLRVALAQYDAAGRPDPSFGTGGKVVTDLTLGSDGARGLALTPGGKALVAGFAGEAYGLGSFTDPAVGNVAVACYLPNGRLDPAFGRAGVALTDFGGGGDGGRAAVLDGESLLVAGGANGPLSGDVAVARYRLT